MTPHPSRIALAALAVALVSASVAAQDRPAPTSAVADPALWPALKAVPRQTTVEKRVAALLAKMSLEDKVGQLLQVDIGSIKPVDVETYKIGSVLNGGNSGPYDDELAPPAKWLKLADEFYDASIKRSDGRPAIPIIWGTDAVHGNNNIIGATLFPHNIGLGAAADPDLIRRIGEVTSIETAAAGQDWTFAPTLAVVQDDRWGRTYESYAEEPQIPADYAKAMIEGVQGKLGTKSFLSPDHLIATTKHFLGDGGTGGRDQGDTRASQEVLRDVHLGGYPAAIAAGTQSVMVSFSSWNGVKMSGNKSLLTDVLKERMKFDGFVIGDWNSHGQVPGCSNESCAAAINAGMDMFMYSGPDWKKLYENTLAQAKSGEIPQARIDDAVRRILRVKVRAGTFDRGRPSARAFAGKFDAFGAPAHHAVARAAVRESLVLLKNEGVLPLKPSANILVAGAGADDISQQAGGWTITWQGTGVTNKDFPNAQSIWSGISETVAKSGGKAILSPDGSFTTKPDAAIVVFGEQPYAEFKGDIPNLEYSPGDKSDLQLLRKLKAAGVPVVAVFLSGRPLWVNAELNASDAFVAAFLPGSEGGGVADVLFADTAGKPRFDFRGKLSFSWPKRPDQYVLNRRDPGYDPLFAYGYGLRYAAPGHVGTLDETRPAGMAAATIGQFYAKGRLPDGWTMVLDEPGQASVTLGRAAAASAGGRLAARYVDRRAQEDALALVWSGPAALRIVPPQPIDLDRESNGELSLVMEYRLDRPATGVATLGLADTARSTAVPIAGLLGAAQPGTWTTLAVPLKCFAAKGAAMKTLSAPFTLSANKGSALTLSDVRLDYVSMPMDKCGG
ncbi:glycoside hydrolase family 3 protein [Sphingomonas sp. PB4P5]|uniref:glycoside hydrolase family 3 protein n=1 Tax=Parasphingomonas puruogangriensis TaxID=3096155 RepID=UPI002FC8DDB9